MLICSNVYGREKDILKLKTKDLRFEIKPETSFSPLLHYKPLSFSEREYLRENYLYPEDLTGETKAWQKVSGFMYELLEDYDFQFRSKYNVTY